MAELTLVCGYKDEDGKFYETEDQYLLSNVQKEYEKLVREMPKKMWDIWQDKGKKRYGKSFTRTEYSFNHPPDFEAILNSKEFHTLFLPELFRLSKLIKKFQEQ